MSPATFLALGRVSNLPTVWTNTVAGAALAGSLSSGAGLPLLLVAMTLAYTGGMFLNDAFDRDIDARERPQRPIPAGLVEATTVFRFGYGMLAASVLIVAAAWLASPAGSAGSIVAALSLGAAIIAYNRWHKGNPYGPALMGLCRMLVYMTAGLTLVSVPSPQLYLGASILFAYLIGLTYTAKQEHIGRVENLWPLALLAAPLLYGCMASIDAPRVIVPTLLLGLCLLVALHLARRRQRGDVPRAVALMIAGIALVDAIFLADTVGIGAALLAMAAGITTLLLQRLVAGT